MSYELNVQTYLREGGSLAALEQTYAIKAKRHPAYPNLVLLKYSQIDSPFVEKIVRECRGIILDESENWSVVSHTFDKFFNHEEGHAAQIDWSTAEVQEKLDGSLMQLYWYDGRWQVASSGTPDASGKVVSAQQEGTETFATLFWRTCGEQGLTVPGEEHRHLTFAFELMTPFNRVVVPHKEARLVLIGVRNIRTNQELTPKLFGFKYPVVRSFPLTSVDACVASFQHIDPLSQEGYVVCDGAFNRVKMKHPGYVALHHLAGDGFGPKRVLEIVRTGEIGEVLTYYPEWKPTFDDLGGKYSQLVGHLEDAWGKLQSIPVGSKDDQKTFALEANKTRYPSALFQVRRGTATSIRDYLAGVNVKHLMQALNITDNTEN